MTHQRAGFEATTTDPVGRLPTPLFAAALLLLRSMTLNALMLIL